LTSQLEDMLFRIRVTALDPVSKKPIDYLTAVSDPIKVVSKPEQIKKKPKPICKPKENPAAIAAAHKRQADEMVIESLDAVEHRCSEQQELLASLVQLTEQRSSLLTGALDQTLVQKPVMDGLGVASPTSSLSPPTSCDEASSPARKLRKMKSVDAMQVASPVKVAVKGPSAADLFEAVFAGFMRSYDKLSSDDRPQRIRKCVLSLGARDSQTVAFMLQQCAQACEEKKSSPLPLAPFMASPPLPPVQQPVLGKHRDLVMKEEMEKIDQFYNSDFLALSSPAY